MPFIIFKSKTENKTGEKKRIEVRKKRVRGESAYLRDLKSSIFHPSPLAISFFAFLPLDITLLQPWYNHFRCECGGRCIVGPVGELAEVKIAYVLFPDAAGGKVNHVKVSIRALVYL